MDYTTIRIIMKDGAMEIWRAGEWTDYCYNGRLFIIKQGDSWVGMYNTDCIKSMRVFRDCDYEDSCEAGDNCDCGEKVE